MRFISPSAGYRLVAVHQETQRLADGTTNILAPGFTAEFRQSDTTDWEREEARRRFTFRGTTIQMDGVTPVDPINRVSSFDTSTIKDAALRKQVEEALLNNAANGFDYILVEKPKLPAPWPKYDEIKTHGQKKIEHVVKEILAGVETTGVEPEAVIAYERENANREEVIDALNGLLPAPTPEDELIAA